MLKKLIVDDFLKKIPEESKQMILSEMDKFISEYEDNNRDINSMSKGFYTKQIKGNKYNPIYKFRVNKSDRILFTYGKYLENIREEYSDSIIFIDYCNHDSQIVKGKKVNINNKTIKIDEDKWDEEIDKEYIDYKYDPNKLISRIVSVETLAEMLDNEDERAIYYLNEEQFELLKSDITPLFIFGSAGSGKTTMGINKAFSLCQDDISIGYFTYSKHLVEQSQNLFKTLCKSENKEYDDNIKFNDLNKYILDLAKKQSYVKYEEFENWYEDKLLKTMGLYNFNIDKKDIWKEIRGIIKGLVYIDWIDISLNKSDLHKDTIDFILNKKLGVDNKNHIKLINKDLATLMDKIEIYKSEGKNYIYKDLSYIYNKIDERIYSKKTMSKDVYVKLPKKYSRFSEDERVIIYNIVSKYQDWLDKNNKVDENDIARVCLSKYHNEDIELFDFLICDEVQDLTEIQIYFLCKIIKNKEKILFSGDYNQTINPTFFDTGRIESLYKINNGIDNFNKRSLSINYRSSKNIVDLANDIASLREEKLKKTDNDYKEIPIRGSNDKLFLLNQIKDNKTKLLKTALKRHYVGIVVPDDEEKETIEAQLGVKDIVFTVSEIKGIEKDYIICVNVLSKYKHMWNEVFKNNIDEDKEKFRFYFNLLYVAITRARNNICFIEDDKSTDIYKYISKHIQEFNIFDEYKLKIDRQSGLEDFFREGLKLEQQELYKKAIQYYKNANIGEDTTRIAIKRCEALLKDSQGNHHEAGDDLMQINEYSLAGQCYKKNSEYLNYFKALVHDNETYEGITKKLGEVDRHPIKLIHDNKNKIDWIDKFNEIYEQYECEKISILKTNIEEMKDITKTSNKNIKELIQMMNDSWITATSI